MSNHRHPDAVHPGFFTMRLVKGGPLVPARIWRPCHCTINGGLDNEAHDWRPDCDRWHRLEGEAAGKPAPVDIIWQFGQFIDQAEFEYLTDVAEWDAHNDAASPHANPREAVDLRAMRPIF